MSRKLLIALGFAGIMALSAAAGVAVAQGPGPAAEPGPHPGMPQAMHMPMPALFANPARVIDRIFDRFDRDYDGVIDLAEFRLVIEHKFDQIDTAKKGAITAADIKAAIAEMHPMMGRRPGAETFADAIAARVLAEFGKPADGQITKAEFVAAYDAVFKYLNRSGDGKITRQEVQDYINVARRIAPMMRP